MKKGLVIVLAASMMVLSAGCGSSYSKGGDSSLETMNATADMEMGYDGGYYEEAVTEEAPMESPAEGQSTPQVADTQRKLIKNVDMSVETRDFDELIPLIEKKVAELGGYIENSNIYNGSNYYDYKPLRSASLTVRIPKDSLDGFINDVKGTSNVVSCNQSVRDVTLTYVDMESHKKALQVEQERLIELLDQAESVEDIITIESRLSQVRYEIESMEAQLRSYDNQVDYSTVYMDISEVEELTPVVEETTWERIANGFVESVKNVTEGIKEFFIGLIINLPYIAVWVIILGAVVLVTVKLARHSMKKENKKPDKPTAEGEENKQKKETYMTETGYKSGFVNLIGRPNVGKSTLMNRLIGQKIAITSRKPQTTRNRIQTVYTSEKGQIVFLDTPGIHKSKNKLGEYMVNVAERTISEVDVILWLVEPTDYIGAGEQHIIEKLKKTKTPVILVINKIDKVKKEELLHFIEVYSKELDFAEIVPVSALRGQNTQELIQCIFKYLPYGEPFYDEDTITDQPMRQLVAELIREKALRLLGEEIPHGVAVSIESMKYRKDIVDIEATIVCERESHKGIIIGKGGQMLKKIGTTARIDIEKLVEMQANLQLWVKVKKDWRDSDFLMKNFGYNPKDSE